MNNEDKILCIDIGGTSIKIGVVYKDNIIESASVRNSFKGNFDMLIPSIKDLCNLYINKYQLNKMAIGCPGDIDMGKLIFASNLGWQNIDLLKEFQNNFKNVEVRVANDGVAASLAERTYGYLKDVSDAIFVTIGKGIGGCIISNGNELKGNHNFGSRFGHMVIKSGGRRCNCGRKGCFEAYGSISGLIKTTKEYNQKWTKKEDLIDIDKLSGYKILNYLKDGNKLVKESINRWNKDIVIGLLNLCHIVDPSIIVIAGGVTESEFLNLDFIKVKLAKHKYDKCEVKLATLKGKTGLVGAGCLFNK